MDPNAQSFAALVGKRAHVNILFKDAFLCQLHCSLAHLVDAVRHLHSHYLTAVNQPLVVLFLAEKKYLLLLAVPVTPNAFKNGRSVMQGMSHDVYVGFGEGNELVFKKGVGWHDESPFPENNYHYYSG
jgi:hypothetical protein